MSLAGATLLFGIGAVGPPRMESGGCGGPIWGSVLAVRPGGSTSQPTDSPHPSSLRDIAPPIDGTHVFSLFVSMVQKSL